MNESEAYNHGKYETYEQALIEAKNIVWSALMDEYKPGMKEDELTFLYCMYGEDPAILSGSGGDFEIFSAWDYAHEIAGEI